jgi:hypothetical protein
MGSYALGLRQGPMLESLKLVGRFVVQMIVATVLFAVVAGLAYLLWRGTQWLQQQGVPDHLYVGAWAITELLFGLDVLCFVVFTVGETIKLLRAIIKDMRN